MARDISDVNAVIRAAQEQQRLVKELGRKQVVSEVRFGHGREEPAQECRGEKT